MIKALFLICSTSISLSLIAQGKKYDYFADARFDFVKEQYAAFGAKGISDNGLYRLDFYNLAKGSLTKSVHYKNEKVKQKEGFCITYYPNGKIEWQGTYKKNEFDQLWLLRDSMGHTIDSVIYDAGKLKFDHFYFYSENGDIKGYRITDNTLNTVEQKKYYENGKLQSEVAFTGEKGVLKEYDSLGKVKVTALSSRSETEASFPGGAKEFKKYLANNLNANTPIEHGAPVGTYIVIVKFAVAEDGSISDIAPETNAGYGMEQEVVKMIQQSPPWESAVQFGMKVKAYRRQPVTFVVENEKRRRRN